GNEQSHLFVRNQDGTIKDLTPGQKLKARFFGWSHDQKSFFVMSNERDEHFFDLYEYASGDYARTLFYRNEKGFNPEVLSRDKRYLALSKSRTTNDSDIWLLDRQTGKTLNITAHKG